MTATVGTASGNKDLLAMTVGTSAGNKDVTEGWVGTASGNKQFYSGFSVSASPLTQSWSVQEYDYNGDGITDDTVIYAVVTAIVQGGQAPISYHWVATGGVGTPQNPSDAACTVFGSLSYSCTLQCTVTDGAGNTLYSNTVTINP